GTALAEPKAQLGCNMNRLAMVDGETVWQELYPRGCGSLGLIGCGYRRRLAEVWNCVHVDISSGTRIAKRARFDNAQAIVRCGEPLQLQLWVRIFCLRSRSGLIIEWQRRKRPLSGAWRAVARLARHDR
ncbi:MAG TPA: hypothetical protein VK577_18430, partial [Bradyrhizobium sp.]|nr:hypothetical protein [Bradyrhizobium sp.]